MNKRTIALLVGVALVSSCSKGGAKSVSIKTDVQKASYAIGQQIGRGMKQQGIEVDVDVVAMSIADVLAGRKSQLSDDEMRKASESMRKKMMSIYGLNGQVFFKFIVPNAIDSRTLFFMRHSNPSFCKYFMSIVTGSPRLTASLL